MSDLISRQAAIDILDAFEVKIENGEPFAYSWARMRITELHSAQPDRKKGKWIDDEFIGQYRCSECDYYSIDEYDFCPNCGADMRGEKNETD